VTNEQQILEIHTETSIHSSLFPTKKFCRPIAYCIVHTAAPWTSPPEAIHVRSLAT